MYSLYEKRVMTLFIAMFRVKYEDSVSWEIPWEIYIDFENIVYHTVGSCFVCFPREVRKHYQTEK